MINSFPWDSLQSELGEDGFPVYDRAYNATDLQEVYKSFFSNGVFLNYSASFQVTAASNMSLSVLLGKCLINGVVGYANPKDPASQILMVPAAASQPRIDTVVLRWDKAISARSIVLDIISGTPAPVPVRPALTRNDEVWELGLCDVLVPANSTSVAQKNITDTRLDSSRCGPVTPFATIDTTSFYAKLEAAINEQLAKHEAKANAQMQKLNDEIDRVIYISDRLTAGSEDNTCGCYHEIEQLKQLVYQLMSGQQEQKYYVVSKELYCPPTKATESDGTVTFASGSVTGKTLALN